MKNPWLKVLLGIVVVSLAASTARAETTEPKVAGKDILKERAVELNAEGHKGLVVVFLSARCPCSNSHVVALKELAAAHPDFSFVGVHANSDEPKTETVEYFKKAALPFPVLQDTGGKLAARLRALKTPHAFLIAPSGEILYRGGVSDSRDYAKAKQKFLSAALAEVHDGKPVANPAGRTLGCVIARGDKDDW
jgi:hypothetical protein